MTMFPNINRLPDKLTLETETGRFSFAGAALIEKDDVRIELTEGERLSVSLTADTTPILRLHLRWNTKIPTVGTKFMCDAWERGYGDFEWRGFVPERVMPWMFYANKGPATAGYGVRVRPDAMCFFLCDPNGISLVTDVRCGALGIILGGKTITCAEVVCKEYTGVTPYEAACAFSKELVDKVILPEKPVYGANNWYYAYGMSSHEEILGDAAFLARLTKGLDNRPFMVIDDGWQKLRVPEFIGGPWDEGNERFPDMKRLADEIAAMDVIPGIWIRPLWNRDPSIPEEARMSFDKDFIDPSTEAGLAQIAKDVRTVADWGYKLIKHDFSTYDIFHFWGVHMRAAITDLHGVSFADRSKSSAMIVKDLYQTIHDAAEGKSMILGCNCIGHLGVGLMELNRTGDDTSGVQWERTRQRGVNTLAFRMPQHNTFFAVDADCAGITDAIDWKKNEQWLYLLANSGTPLFVSVKPGTLNEEQEKILAKAYAAASEARPTAEPLDWMDTTCPSDWIINGRPVSFNWYEETGIEDVMI